MKYQLKKGKSPAYLQIYAQIKDDIVSLAYPYGAKLPSKRTLCEEIGVSVITVEHAYSLLCEEGYVEPRERSGFVVCFRKEDGFAASASLSQKYHSAYHKDHTYYTRLPYPAVKLTALIWPVTTLNRESALSGLLCSAFFFTEKHDRGFLVLEFCLSAYCSPTWKQMRQMADDNCQQTSEEMKYLRKVWKDLLIVV